MSFLRKKTINGREYVYEVENYRTKDGQTRQRVLRYVGPTDPAIGGRGPVDLVLEREKLGARRNGLDPSKVVPKDRHHAKGP